MLGMAHSLLESASQEMDTYYEERSEEWQASERGERFAELMEPIQQMAVSMEDLKQEIPGLR